jgi:hypothetical protein
VKDTVEDTVFANDTVEDTVISQRIQCAPHETRHLISELFRRAPETVSFDTSFVYTARP